MRKNFLKMAVLGCAVVSALAGCSGSKSTTDTTAAGAASTTAGAETTAATSDEKITLRFVTWLSADKEQNELVAAAYEAEHPNIDIVYEYYGDAEVQEYYKKVDLMVMGNEPMDILVAGNYTDHSKRAVTGAYLPLDELLAAKGIDPTEMFDFAPTVEGETFALPFEWKSWLVMINKDMLEENGLEVPSLDWTWDDYREYAKVMTSGEGPDKVYGSLFVDWEQYNMLGMWSQMENYPFIKEDGTPNYDDPAFKEWLEFRMAMENDDQSQVQYSIVKSTSLNYRAEFFNEKVGMMPISTFILTELDDVSKYPHDFETTFAPIPAWGDSEPGSSLTESVYYSVGANSPHPQEAFDYILYYVTDGAQIKKSSISVQAGVNKMDFVNTMIDNTDLVDMEALENVLTNPDYKNRVFTDIPTFNSELISMLKEELEVYYFGQGDIDSVIATLMKRGNEIMADNAN